MNKPTNQSDRTIMLMTDPQLHRHLKALSPVDRARLANSATGAFRLRAWAMLNMYNMERVIEVDEVDIVGEKVEPRSPLTHDERVSALIKHYRSISKSDYEAWDKIREEYRKKRSSWSQLQDKEQGLALRDAEHYLFRYFLASDPADSHCIPGFFGSDKEAWYDQCQPFAISKGFMYWIHDPWYNFFREPVRENLGLDWSPTTPSMQDWEQRGYKDGHEARCKKDPKWCEEQKKNKPPKPHPPGQYRPPNASARHW